MLCPRTSRTRGPCLGAVAVVLVGVLAALDAASMPLQEDGVVRFFFPDSTAQQVFLAGDFNGWSQSATPLDREGAGFVTRVFLDPGSYEYKFLVDGTWRADPDNPELSARSSSVLRVGPNGEVLPPRPAAAAAGSGDASAAAGADLGWSLRYLGFVTARRDPTLDRYDLDRPLHDVDLRLDAKLTPELSAFFLATLTNRGPDEAASQLSLRYDRGQIEWTPGVSRLRLFDNVGVGSFDDPGVLLGRVGIYADEFGYRQRGLAWRQRVFGAPLDVVYTDDTEPGANLAPGLESAPPSLVGPGIAATGTPDAYRTAASHRGADVLALRVRGGTDELGLGLGGRLDRGRNRGVALFFESDSLPTSAAAYETAERWAAWGGDLRGRWRGLRFSAEYLEGQGRADAQQWSDAFLGDSTVISSPRTTDATFALDRSRRGILELRAARAGTSTGLEPAWSARPGTGRVAEPSLAYEYEEHDFTALVTGEPFLMRRHGLCAGIDGRVLETDARLEAEQHWFCYPAAASWATQFWFRRHNGWLDEDVVSLERATLLGAPAAAVARLHLARLLWASRGWRGELHATWAAPGFDHAPRYGEGILRLAFPLRNRLELRTHSRLACYRQIETQDSGIVAALGPGPHFEAGALPFAGDAPVEHSYRAFSAHFVELVYAITERSDIALGFGVDPIVVYEVTNEYEPIGWDAFLSANGADPASYADSGSLGAALEQAEGALERERRIGLEARLRF